MGGLLVLGVGGEMLVTGARRLAVSLGVSPLVVGLTVVAFGTSAPEVAVSVIAALQGEDEIAVGNVVGSNISNILLILGLAAVVRPLDVALNIIRTDAPIMLLVFGVFVLMAVDNGYIDRWQGMLFITALIGYVVMTYYMARREPREVRNEYEAAMRTARAGVLNIVLLVLGVAALVGGASWIVTGAVGIAELLGVSKRVIALTTVAIGTSLPELATTISAVRRNQVDMAVGNVIGSNIFNVLSVVGLAATIKPLHVPVETMYADGPFMLAVAVLALLACWRRRTIPRWNGFLFLALYAAFLAWTFYPEMR